MKLKLGKRARKVQVRERPSQAVGREPDGEDPRPWMDWAAIRLQRNGGGPDDDQ